MSQFVDLTKFYTREQSNRLFLLSPQAPDPPSGFGLRAKAPGDNWITMNSTGVFAYLLVQLIDPSRPAWADPSREFILSYEFLITYGDGSSASIGVSWRSDGFYKIDGLIPGAQVSVSVQSVDYFNQTSVPTTPFSTTCDFDQVAPAPPTISVTAIGAGARIAVNALNTEPDFKSYLLYRGRGYANGSWTVPATLVLEFTTASTIDQAIPADADDYFYYVTAGDLSGNISTSNIFGPLALKGTGQIPPPAPSMTSATVTANADGSLTFRFVQGTTVDSPGLSQYHIWRKSSLDPTWQLLHTSAVTPAAAGSGIFFSYTDVTTINGVTYTYSASALNSVGGESSFDLTGVSNSSVNSIIPNPVLSSTISFTGRLGGVDLTWTPSTSADILFYGLSLSFDGGATWGTTTQVNGNSFTVLGLTQDRTLLANLLAVKLVAIDVNLHASVPAVATATFPQLISYQPAASILPAAPTTLGATSNQDGSVTLQWTAPVVSNLRGYQLERYTSTTGLWMVVGSLQDGLPGSKHFSDEGLQPYNVAQVQYRWRVRSLDYSGNISAPNLVENPSFATGDLSSWSVRAAGASVVSSASLGPYNLEAGNAQRPFQTLSIAPSLVYTFSAFMKMVTAPDAVTISFAFLDGSHNQIGSVQTSAPVTASANWQRLTVTATAPATAAYVTINLDGASAPADQFYWTEVQFEQSLVANTFADAKTGLVNVVQTAGPGDYLPTIAATGQLGGIAITWNNPTTAFLPSPPTHNGYIDYLNGVYEVWRTVPLGANPLLPDTAHWSKLNDIPSAADGGQNTYVDAMANENVSATFFYAVRARDRYGNASSSGAAPVFLASNLAVSATSKTMNDIRPTALPSTPVWDAGYTSFTSGAQYNLTVTWSEPGSTASILHYEVLVQVINSNSAGVGVPVLYVVPKGSPSQTVLATAGQTYRFQVRACDVFGNRSPFTAIGGKDILVAGTPPAAGTSPTAPSGITAGYNSASGLLQFSFTYTATSISVFVLFRSVQLTSGAPSVYQDFLVLAPNTGSSAQSFSQSIAALPGQAQYGYFQLAALALDGTWSKSNPVFSVTVPAS